MIGRREGCLFRVSATSRGSSLKVDLPDDGKFDLVSFHHGINEAQANSVPPDRFRDDYSHRSFIGKESDDSSHRLPIELWGVPAQVRDAVQKDNAVVRKLAREHGTLFVDQDRPIPKTGADFDDIRHLTPHGGREFVKNFQGIVLDRLASVASGENP